MMQVGTGHIARGKGSGGGGAQQAINQLSDVPSFSLFRSMRVRPLGSVAAMENFSQSRPPEPSSCRPGITHGNSSPKTRVGTRPVSSSLADRILMILGRLI